MPEVTQFTIGEDEQTRRIIELERNIKLHLERLNSNRTEIEELTDRLDNISSYVHNVDWEGDPRTRELEQLEHDVNDIISDNALTESQLKNCQKDLEDLRKDLEEVDGNTQGNSKKLEEVNATIEEISNALGVVEHKIATGDIGNMSGRIADMESELHNKLAEMEQQVRVTAERAAAMELVANNVNQQINYLQQDFQESDEAIRQTMEKEYEQTNVALANMEQKVKTTLHVADYFTKVEANTKLKLPLPVGCYPIQLYVYDDISDSYIDASVIAETPMDKDGNIYIYNYNDQENTFKLLYTV